MLLLPSTDDAEAQEVLIMGHPVETLNSPPWKSAVERQYEAFLGQLSPKGRSNIQKHDALNESESAPEHCALWKRFAGRFGKLAGYLVEASGQHTVKFYIADGKYKLQVFALEDTPQGTIVVYLPDVVQSAVGEKLLAAGAAAQQYQVPGATGPLQLTPIDAQTRDLTVCKGMVGWGRRAVSVEFGTSAPEAHVHVVEQMCEMAAQKWAHAAV